MKADEKKGGGLNLKALLKNKYALIVLAVGVLLLLLPVSGGSSKKETVSKDISAPAFSLEDEELRLQRQLSRLKGAGRVSVLLSVMGSASRELAESGEETLVLSAGNSEDVVELYYVNPEYIGAVIVCDGADLAQVRLAVTEAVCAFTGLPSQSVKVMQMS